MKPQFRAWTGEYYVIPDYVDKDGVAWWKENSVMEHSDILELSSGIADEYGEKIFEGDILEDDQKSVYEIRFDPFRGFYGIHRYCDFKSWCEDKDGNKIYDTIEEVIRFERIYCCSSIIGTVRESPELLT